MRCSVTKEQRNRGRASHGSSLVPTPLVHLVGSSFLCHVGSLPIHSPRRARRTAGGVPRRVAPFGLPPTACTEGRVKGTGGDRDTDRRQARRERETQDGFLSHRSCLRPLPTVVTERVKRRSERSERKPVKREKERGSGQGDAVSNHVVSSSPPLAVPPAERALREKWNGGKRRDDTR